MKLTCRYIIIFVFALFFASFHGLPDLKPSRILQLMNDSIKNIKTLRVNISALEREAASFHTANSEIKLQTKPRRLYFKNPEKKVQILYTAGQLNNKALVRSASVPLTLTLDPMGQLMRKDQHYTIHELGFDFVAKGMSFIISKDKEGLNNFKYYGKVAKNGYQCHLLEYENKNFGYVDYIVGEHETVSSIANKTSVNEYLIHYKNGLLNHYDYLKKGSVIKIPNLFCKKAVLYIDEKTMLPVVASLFDDKGVFENYEYTKMEINKIIPEEEFMRNYKGYNF
ncbi:MAG: DUF1571 domain-containing protein [Bacteroidetes bacterium]|nr:DUF1571 domain-containing protein [Bacteroidota bacterium]